MKGFNYVVCVVLKDGRKGQIVDRRITPVYIGKDRNNRIIRGELDVSKPVIYYTVQLSADESIEVTASEIETVY